MGLFPKLKFKKQAPENKKLTVEEIVRRELQSYITQNDLQEYLKKIERDKEKKRIWDGLSNSKKIKLLRYVLNKKEAQHGK